MLHFGGIYVQQSGDVEVFASILDRFDSETDKEDTLRKLALRYGSYSAPDMLHRLLRQNGRLFFDVDDWKDEISACDFSIGTRYHGNALAMQASVPALVATHDSRTDELCRATCIPTISIDSITPMSQLRDLVSAIDFDPHAYDRARRSTASMVHGALQRAGIAPSPRLRSLANLRPQWTHD
jgi:hypothetical protein